MPARPRLAVISTEYRPNSHSDVIVTRWLEPLPTDREVGWPVGGGDKPRTEIASLYLHTIPENDTGRAHAAKHNVPVYKTIREALTLGGDSLAVDGVLLIGEHGHDLVEQLAARIHMLLELVPRELAVLADE